jgi:hypothetical protein
MWFDRKNGTSAPSLILVARPDDANQEAMAQADVPLLVSSKAVLNQRGCLRAKL